MFSKQLGLFASIALILAGCSGDSQTPSAAAPTSSAPKGDVAFAAPAGEGNATIAYTDTELKQGKKLFQAECGKCHVGGQTYGTYNSTDLSLSFEALSGATPQRNNVPALIDYLKKPTSYDGKTLLAPAGEHPVYTNLGEDKLRLLAGHVLKEATQNPGWGKGKNVR